MMSTAERLSDLRQPKRVKTGSIADLFHNETSVFTRAIRKSTTGAGPSTFAEQNSRVFTFLTKDPKAASYRACSPEDCVYGAWVGPVSNPDKVFNFQKYEIIFRIIDPSENGSRVVPIRSGVPTVYGYTSVTNLRKGLEIAVIGGVRNPSAGRGERKLGLDSTGTCVEGGTDTIPNSGPFRIHPADQLYGIEEPHTRPKDPADGGRSGFESMHKMKGLHDQKFLLQPVPFAATDIHEIVSSKKMQVDTDLNELIYKTSTRRMQGSSVLRTDAMVSAPLTLDITNYIERLRNDLDSKSQGNINPESRIRGFQSFMVLYALYTIMRHGITVQGSSAWIGTDDREGWKSLVQELYVLSAEELKKYYNDQYDRLPTTQKIWSSLEWRKKLPFFMDYTYRADQAFEQMKAYTVKDITHVEHIMLAIERTNDKNLRQIVLFMERRFMGSALSGGEPGFSCDIDWKRK